MPIGADIAVELYGGAVTLRLNGAQRRIYIRRFEFVSFSSDEEARHRVLTLWREVEALDSTAEVERAADEWLKSGRESKPSAASFEIGRARLFVDGHCPHPEPPVQAVGFTACPDCGRF